MSLRIFSNDLLSFFKIRTINPNKKIMNDKAQQFMEDSQNYKVPIYQYNPPTELDINGNIVVKKKKKKPKKKPAIWKPKLNNSPEILR
ncbi:hypothetical protein N8Z76_00415 [Gammaproteobacteria bacterium]|nr:hypothetical protein [Gammaproteobacteria bacterium]